MHFVIFTHSLVSDWNHGNAHFLRGIATELVHRHHTVDILEPENGWSRRNLVRERGEDAVRDFETAYPLIRSRQYDERVLDLKKILTGADIVIVHEWNSHDLVRRIGEQHQRYPSFQLFFHDTHHRSATDPASMAAYDLQHYDGVLAYGGVVRDRYLANRWAARAWAWHEAADTSVFHPLERGQKEGDLVWIGNWGDDERSDELREFLIAPARALGLKARVYGVRYPQHALRELAEAHIEYGGYLPNYLVPEVFARYRFTIHVPRRPYAAALPGIPTIRPFEALACGIPLISAPWDDCEKLFRPAQDFLFARDGKEMGSMMTSVLDDAEFARTLAASGLHTIRSRHTCAHRVDELLAIASRGNRIATGAGAD